MDTRHLREAFERVYSDGRWGVGFGSAHGSRRHATRECRSFLEDFLRANRVLQHLPVADIQEILRSVVPRFLMALVINDAPTTPANLNIDIPTGAWRPVDVRDPPFGASAVVIKLLRMPRARSRTWRLRRNQDDHVAPW